MTAQMESPVQTEEMRRFEEFDAAFPDYHAEMIDGEVYLSTVVTSAHGNMVLTIASQLCIQVVRHDRGRHGLRRLAR